MSLASAPRDVAAGDAPGEPSSSFDKRKQRRSALHEAEIERLLAEGKQLATPQAAAPSRRLSRSASLARSLAAEEILQEHAEVESPSVGARMRRMNDTPAGERRGHGEPSQAEDTSVPDFGDEYVSRDFDSSFQSLSLRRSSSLRARLPASESIDSVHARPTAAYARTRTSTPARARDTRNGALSTRDTSLFPRSSSLYGTPRLTLPSEAASPHTRNLHMALEQGRRHCDAAPSDSSEFLRQMLAAAELADRVNQGLRHTIRHTLDVRMSRVLQPGGVPPSDQELDEELSELLKHSDDHVRSMTEVLILAMREQRAARPRRAEDALVPPRTKSDLMVTRHSGDRYAWQHADDLYATRRAEALYSPRHAESMHALDQPRAYRSPHALEAARAMYSRAPWTPDATRRYAFYDGPRTSSYAATHARSLPLHAENDAPHETPAYVEAPASSEMPRASAERISARRSVSDTRAPTGPWHEQLFAHSTRDTPRVFSMYSQTVPLPISPLWAGSAARTDAALERLSDRSIDID